MFGETEMIGRETLKIDKSGRITLPGFTNVEVGDELNFQFDPYFKSLSIYNSAAFEERANIVRNNLKKKYPNQILEPKQFNRFYHGKLSFMSEEVDSKKRIKIPESAISKLGLSDEIFIIGQGNHLVLCKDEETYEELQRKKQEEVIRKK